MMKQEALFKKLGNILNELNEQYEFLAQNPAQLSEVELELFQANANFLADHIQIIKKLNLPMYRPFGGKNAGENVLMQNEDEIGTQEDVAVFAARAEEQDPALMLPQEQMVKETAAPEIVEGVPFELPEETAQTFEFILNTIDYDEDDKFEFEEKNPDELFDSSLTTEEELILAQKKQQNLEPEPQPEAQSESEQGDEDEDEIGPEPFLVRKEDSILADQPVVNTEIITPIAPELPKVTLESPNVQVEPEYKPTINELLSGNTKANRVNHTSGPAISDLKSAINLNDKLLYIKDLFNGYSLAYAEAIDIANKMADFNAADNFLQKNYASKNNWAANQETVDKFYLLLNRRFKS